MYDKGKHLDWWQSLPATDRFPLMKKYDVKQVNNKLIYRMWNGELPTAKDNLVKCIVNGNALTQEQIDNRTSDYVCWDCGRQFLTEVQKNREGVVTAHKSICGLCGVKKSVTHIRQWNWLRCH